MLKIVIPTTPPDSEAFLVAAALRRQGYSCDLLYTSDYPTATAHTLSFCSEETKVEFSGPDDCPENWTFDICWLRDLHPPLINFDYIHPADQAFVTHANRQYYLQHWSLLADARLSSAPIFWVNALEAARRAESKPLQLHLARMAGFSVPDTIISNDPTKIRQFLRSRDKKVIRKSLVPHFWNEIEASVTNKTTPVNVDDLPSDKILSVHAEIFQDEVEKIAEVRVVFFGATYFALRIEPNEERSARFVDWRVYHFSGMTKLEPVRIPESVSASCRRLMAMLGIVSASFDLLIDRSGKYFFAELNQGGLFLWMEHHGHPVLQAFTDFLVAQDPKFNWVPPKKFLRLKDIQDSKQIKNLVEQESSHLIPPRQMETTIGGVN